MVWDRVTGEITGRPGAQRLAVTSGGTIPDRGLFGVFLAGADPKKGGGRVGELDEEMVYESRVGDVFTLGTSSWRIEDITRDRVLVSPAPGVPGRLPFWKGDQLGRPLELGRALGAFLREVGSLSDEDARLRLLAAGLDAWAADNVLSYLGSSARRAGTSRTTARSWWSGSATSWATGGWSSTPRSAPRCTPRGRSRWAPACPSGTAWTPR